MKDPKRQGVVDHYMKASELAAEYVEQEARKILVEYADLHEFIMAMGSWHFTWKKGVVDHNGFEVLGRNQDNIILDGDLECIDNSDLASFMAEWDDALKITGEAMRFTATGKLRRDW